MHAVGFDMYLRMLEETVAASDARRRARRSCVPADVSIDMPAYLPDDYIASQDAKLDVYRRLDALRARRGDRGAARRAARPLRAASRAGRGDSSRSRCCGSSGARSGSRGSWCAATRPVLPFEILRIPRMKGLSAAFHEVQFQAEVRRAHPLSLKLTRLGGAPMLDGLVRALRAVV